ncbi:hypothetical protein M885DRAFT_572678, partial [Pelagophyceae sp. CCMP2097]
SLPPPPPRHPKARDADVRASVAPPPPDALRDDVRASVAPPPPAARPPSRSAHVPASAQEARLADELQRDNERLSESLGAAYERLQAAQDSWDAERVKLKADAADARTEADLANAAIASAGIKAGGPRSGVASKLQAELRLQARVDDLEADLELTRKAAGDAQRTANAQFPQLERDLDAARIAQRPAQSGDAWPEASPPASPAASAASPTGPASVDEDAANERLVDEQLARVEEESAEIKRLRRDVEARGKTPITAVALRKRNGDLETQVQDLENRPRRKAGGGLSSIAELLKANRRRSPDAAQNGAEKRCAALEDKLEEQRAHSELRLRALQEEFERLRVVHEKRLGELRQQGLRQSRDAGARQSIDAAAPDDVRRSRPGGVAGAEQRRIAELETQVRALEAAQCSALEGARRGPDAAAGGDGARLESLRVELDREREMRLRGEASAEPARRLLEDEVRSARAAAADSRAEADDALAAPTTPTDVAVAALAAHVLRQQGLEAALHDASGSLLDGARQMRPHRCAQRAGGAGER